MKEKNKATNTPTSNMHIIIQNLGAIKHAEFDINDLTIIVGWNNMGKTYAAYAFYGFLDFWHYGYDIKLPETYYKELKENKFLKIETSFFLSSFKEIMKDASKAFSNPENLAEVFGNKISMFRNASFEVQIDKLDIPTSKKTFTTKIHDKECLQTELENGVLNIHLKDNEKTKTLPDYIFRDMLNHCVKNCIFGSVIPKNRIVCAERTGAAIFQKELDFTRNRIINILGSEESKKLTPLNFLEGFSSRYPLPIQRNVDTVRNVSDNKKRSFLIESQDPQCKRIISLMEEIIGGKYKIVRNEIRYIPNSPKNVKLDMILSSSSIRSLLHLAIYLYFEAQKGDLLIIDEPEQNLHPANQRKIARLLAGLTQLGIKVLITTHSDYIVKELNTLIMMSSASESILHYLDEKYGYKSACEKVLPDKFSLYSSCMDNSNSKRKKMGIIFEKAEIDENGIIAKSFDNEIDQMNQIQEYLYLSGDSSSEEQ